MKDIGRIQDLLKGLHATAFNIVYLQDEVYKFKVHEDGKEWSVYGSPVRLDCKFKNFLAERKLYRSGHQNFVTGHSIMIAKPAKVWCLLCTLTLHRILMHSTSALVENFPKTDIL